MLRPFPSPAPFLADRRCVADADTLITLLGGAAAEEAAARADRARDIGNHLHFCHWRQVERLIDLLSEPRAIGTIH